MTTVPLAAEEIDELASDFEGRPAEELLEWAAARAREGVACIFPEIEKRGGEARVIVAGRDSGALE